MNEAKDNLSENERLSQERRLSILKRSIATVVILVIGFAAFYAYSVGNRRTSVATHLIFGDTDHPNAVAYEAALNARFPRGTSTDLLVKFVEYQGGHCYSGHATSYLCRIPYENSICSSQLIDIRFPNQAVIETIDVKLGTTGCWI